jgi:hypothetical protein
MGIVMAANIVDCSSIRIVSARERAFEGLPANLKIGAGTFCARLRPVGGVHTGHIALNDLQLPLYMLIARELQQTPVAAISDGGLHSLAPQTERLTECEGWIDVGCVGRGYSDNSASHEAVHEFSLLIAKAG